MKIGIIGAGALGLMFGSLLSKNHDVHLLDVNPEMIDKINKEGIHLHDDQNNTDETFYPKAHLNGTLEEKMDAVFVLVKSNYTTASLQANKNLIDSKTYFITLQNGLGNDEKMSEFVDKDHLILGVTRINSRRLGLNDVARANHGITVFGYQDSTKEFASKIAEAFNKKFCDGLTTGYTSMWQDVTNHRKTEIHALNGRIAQLGKLYHIPTPMNQWITDRILELEEKF